MAGCDWRWRGWVAGGLLLLAAGSAGAAGAPRPVPALEAPGDDAGKEREDLPPIPDGEATSDQNAHLPTVGEVKMGREAAAEVPKEYRIIREGPDYERLQRIAAVIAAAAGHPEIVADYRKTYRVPRKADRSRRVPFEWRFQLIERKDGKQEINAFSLAGGPIFVTRDLMRYARSDDELAGVLAHEATHTCYHHVLHMVSRQAKAQKSVMLGALASLLLGLGGAGTGATGALYGIQLYSIARMTGYTQELEREADRVAIDILTKTPYSPVGMLTFMKKMARDDARRNEDHGIYQTHPYSTERTERIEQRLRDLRIDFDAATQRRVSQSLALEIVPGEAGGEPFSDLRLNGKSLIRLAAGENDRTPAQRAERVRERLEDLFLARSAMLRDIRLGPDGTSILVHGEPLLRVLPADARLAGVEAPALADTAMRALQAELWKEKLDGIY